MDSSTHMASACFKLVCDVVAVALSYCISITQCYTRQWVREQLRSGMGEWEMMGASSQLTHGISRFPVLWPATHGAFVSPGPAHHESPESESDAHYMKWSASGIPLYKAHSCNKYHDITHIFFLFLCYRFPFSHPARSLCTSFMLSLMINQCSSSEVGGRPHLCEQENNWCHLC